MLRFARLTFAVCRFVVVFLAASVSAADFSDAFLDRPLLTSPSFFVQGNNITATREPREPLHGDRAGGHSLWISWIAPENGLATLTTDGSSIDTLLGVYILKPGAEAPLTRLEKAVDSDENEISTQTKLQWGVRGGQRYEIAVDGFAGQVGNLQLSITFQAFDELLPRVLRRTRDRSVRGGAAVILTVDIEATEMMDLQWLRNGLPIPDAESPTLVLRDFKPTDVGRYELRLTVNDVQFTSSPVELQINTEGSIAALARNRIEDAESSGIDADPPAPAGAPPLTHVQLSDVGGGVSRGYSGAQIFNTAYATRDPREPLHCGMAGGASYWFAYTPPLDGLATLDTEGSHFDTVLAVYRYAPPLTDYAALIPITCDDNHGADGKTSRLQFEALHSEHYFLVIDGVNGARGFAHLNYSLEPGIHLPRPPVLVQASRPVTASVGTTLVLEAFVTGDEPMHYTWFKNNAALSTPGASTLTLSSIQLSDAGDYSVGVSNGAGRLQTPNAKVRVLQSPEVTVQPSSAALTIGFPATRGFLYQVETADKPFTVVWDFALSAVPDIGGIIWVTNSLASQNALFFRLRKP